MKCPFCGHEETQVKDSRPTEDSAAIRRRRVCQECEARFTTFERIQLRELNVIKGDGKKEPFDRDKLFRSLQVALRKRPVEDEDLERAINEIVRQLESMGESDIPSKKIGHLAMETLSKLDQVGYVRYASVYKDFHEVSDFNQFLGDIEKNKRARTG